MHTYIHTHKHPMQVYYSAGWDDAVWRHSSWQAHRFWTTQCDHSCERCTTFLDQTNGEWLVTTCVLWSHDWLCWSCDLAMLVTCTACGNLLFFSTFRQQLSRTVNCLQVELRMECLRSCMLLPGSWGNSQSKQLVHTHTQLKKIINFTIKFPSVFKLQCEIHEWFYMTGYIFVWVLL